MTAPEESRRNLAAGARGGAVTIAAQGARVAIQLISVPVLARLLSPEDFGLMAMAAVVLAAGDLLRDFGLSTAALRSPRLSERESSNLFWLNSALGAATALLIALLTPVLVFVYDEPQLATMIPVVGASALFSGVQVQLQVRMARKNRFVALGVTDVIAQLLALGTAVACALAGWGYWALVAQVLVAAMTLLLLRWSVERWRPRRPTRDPGTRLLVRDGVRIGAAQLFDLAANNAPALIAGIRFDARTVGLLDRAYQLLLTPLARILTPLNQVLLPTLARESGDRGRLIAILLRLQFAIGTAGVTVYAIAAGASTELVALVLGPSWSEASSLLAILSVGGAFAVLLQHATWSFHAFQRADTLLRFNAVSRTATVGLIALGSVFGIEGLAAGYALGTALSWPFAILMLRRSSNLPARSFLMSAAHVFANAVPVYVVALAVSRALSVHGPLVATTAAAAAALAVAVVLVLVVPSSRRNAREMIAVLLHR